jgi:hypothetical protein
VSSNPIKKRSSSNSATSEKPGRVAFDERGNAIFLWDERLNAEGTAADRQRAKALNHPGLSLVDEHKPAEAGVFRSDLGLKRGYNPYESGHLSGKERAKKRDLRKLSEWIELKKKLSSDA